LLVVSAVGWLLATDSRAAVPRFRPALAEVVEHPTALDYQGLKRDVIEPFVLGTHAPPTSKLGRRTQPHPLHALTKTDNPPTWTAAP
jgi:hypothetical protein